MVMSQDLVQPSLFSSMSTRMSSATAMVGCVSFSWKATLSGKASKSVCVSLYRRTTSCRCAALSMPHNCDKTYGRTPELHVIYMSQHYTDQACIYAAESPKGCSTGETVSIGRRLCNITCFRLDSCADARQFAFTLRSLSKTFRDSKMRQQLVSQREQSLPVSHLGID